MMRVLAGECARIGVARMWWCNGMGLQRCGSARVCNVPGLHTCGPAHCECKRRGCTTVSVKGCARRLSRALVSAQVCKGCCCTGVCACRRARMMLHVRVWSASVHACECARGWDCVPCAWVCNRVVVHVGVCTLARVYSRGCV